MIVAIPKFGETVAPCFEAAHTFVVATIESGQIVSQRETECLGCEGFGRIQLLRDRGAHVLICNGIKQFYRDLLQAAGVTVLARVSMPIDKALKALLDGDLTGEYPAEEPNWVEAEIPLEDLICWTQELFTAHGYRVRTGTDYAPFPIDLVAEIECPVCGKPVRVAICCGAHTYRPEKEVELLHLAAAANYDARVYVHSTTPAVSRKCEEYGVELIDPDARFANRDEPTGTFIPILQSVVPGHEAAGAGRDSLT